jgi:hypothetical protein
MFEFHNCEFDYNSIKTGYTEISNGTGIQPTYTIDIMFDDCYEVAYNSILMRTIGDIIETDTKYVGMIGKDKADPNPSIASIAQQDDSDQLSELQMRMKRSHGFLGNLIGQSVGLVAGGVSTIAKRLLLGNIYTVSLTQAAMDLKSLASGNVISTVQKSLDYASTFQDKPSYMAPGIPSYLTSTSYINTVKKKAPSEGNIYKSVEELAAGTQQDTPETQSVQVTQTTKPVKKLGNIFNKASIANN